MPERKMFAYFGQPVVFPQCLEFANDRGDLWHVRGGHTCRNCATHSLKEPWRKPIECVQAFEHGFGRQRHWLVAIVEIAIDRADLQPDRQLIPLKRQVYSIARVVPPDIGGQGWQWTAKVLPVQRPELAR